MGNPVKHAGHVLEELSLEDLEQVVGGAGAPSGPAPTEHHDDPLVQGIVVQIETHTGPSPAITTDAATHQLDQGPQGVDNLLSAAADINQHIEANSGNTAIAGEHVYESALVHQAATDLGTNIQQQITQAQSGHEISADAVGHNVGQAIANAMTELDSHSISDADKAAAISTWVQADPTFFSSQAGIDALAVAYHDSQDPAVATAMAPMLGSESQALTTIAGLVDGGEINAENAVALVMANGAFNSADGNAADGGAIAALQAYQQSEQPGADHGLVIIGQELAKNNADTVLAGFCDQAAQTNQSFDVNGFLTLSHDLIGQSGDKTDTMDTALSLATTSIENMPDGVGKDMALVQVASDADFAGASGLTQITNDIQSGLTSGETVQHLLDSVQGIDPYGANIAAGAVLGMLQEIGKAAGDGGLSLDIAMATLATEAGGQSGAVNSDLQTGAEQLIQAGLNSGATAEHVLAALQAELQTNTSSMLVNGEVGSAFSTLQQIGAAAGDHGVGLDAAMAHLADLTQQDTGYALTIVHESAAELVSQGLSSGTTAANLVAAVADGTVTPLGVVEALERDATVASNYAMMIEKADGQPATDTSGDRLSDGLINAYEAATTGAQSSNANVSALSSYLATNYADKLMTGLGNMAGSAAVPDLVGAIAIAQGIIAASGTAADATSNQEGTTTVDTLSNCFSTAFMNHAGNAYVQALADSSTHTAEHALFTFVAGQVLTAAFSAGDAPGVGDVARTAELINILVEIPAVSEVLGKGFTDQVAAVMTGCAVMAQALTAITTSLVTSGATIAYDSGKAYVDMCNGNLTPDDITALQDDFEAIIPSIDAALNEVVQDLSAPQYTSDESFSGQIQALWADFCNSIGNL